jgi:hypothetical protein
MWVNRFIRRTIRSCWWSEYNWEQIGKVPEHNHHSGDVADIK